MKIYVAGPWKHRDKARIAADQLTLAGHTVISRWLREHEDSIHHVALQREAMHDVQDLEQCSAVVYLNIEKSEGKATELGMALALGKLVILVGERENNVFLHLPQIQRVDTVQEAIKLLPHL
jgi:nucleoside 2-deoxyribosyltransferase